MEPKEIEDIRKHTIVIGMSFRKMIESLEQLRQAFEQAAKAAVKENKALTILRAIQIKKEINDVWMFDIPVWRMRQINNQTATRQTWKHKPILKPQHRPRPEITRRMMFCDRRD